MDKSNVPQSANRHQDGRRGPTAKSPTQRDRILAALREAGPRGLTTPELLQAGGFRYSSRLRELRQQGHVITSESLGENRFRYVLRQESCDPKPLPDYGATMERSLRNTALPLFASAGDRP